MQDNKIKSFTAASTFPVKVLQDKEIMDPERRIRPRHLQISITNKCNLKCSFCSCADREKGLEMELSRVEKIAEEYAELGCVAVTITGGGEPLLHPHINEIVREFHINNIKVGLVTNGLVLNLLRDDTLKMIDWIRISFDDSRDFREVKQVLNIMPMTTTDWAFSYVISRQPNFSKIKEVIEVANAKNFTHVRIVSDLLDLKYMPEMDDIKEAVRAMGVDDHLVVYQGRKNYNTLGTEECLISLLKPMIDTDGGMYPCCGAQYALDDPSREYNDEMCMGNAEDARKIFWFQGHFDGSKCKRCYYSEYNTLLQSLVNPVSHKEFL